MPDGTPPRIQVSDGTNSVIVDAAGGLRVSSQDEDDSPSCTRLSDGTDFYDGTKTGQLPSSLVSGRLDTQVGTALPAGTNEIGKLVGGNSEGRSRKSWPGGLTLKTDLTADNTSKILTVPSGKIWRVFWCFAKLATGASSGDRQIALEFRDATDDNFSRARTGVLTANSVSYSLNFQSGGEAVSILSTFDLTIPLPPAIYLPTGFDIHFRALSIQSLDTLKAYAIVDEMDDS